MGPVNQEKLKTYLDRIASNGEIASFVMRRIRLESTFHERNKNIQFWAINFACATALINLLLLLRQLPYRAIANSLLAFSIYWAPTINFTLPAIILFALALTGIGVFIWHTKKREENNHE